MQFKPQLNKFLRLPSIVKKLLLGLFISICFNLILLSKIISPSSKSEKQKTSSTKTQQVVTEEVIKDYCHLYLENFFGIEKTNLDFIAENTETSLFIESLRGEMLNRAQAKIQSKIEVHDIYVENNGSKDAKAYIWLSEMVSSNGYQNRNIKIDLIIELAKFKVKAIPKFEVENA